ncbi:MAG TPA: 4Fe-4S dicluster domain-containing protein, partial [Bacteroidota bacterium]|nr:4Fe-4S dicluster domain-containing protein [Bacteroidota bacterium]
SSMSRKQFLALLSASAAFAAAGCADYRDKGEIVPYTRKPEEVTPGVPNFYASTCTGCDQACGILIKTREGRPIKIDGNPDHPINRGAICAKGQASVLNLYDPNRLRVPRRGTTSGQTGDLDWASADVEIRRAIHEAGARKKQIAVITSPVHSPTTRRLIQAFAAAYPTVRHYSYALFHDQVRRDAWNTCYGDSALPAIAWDEARVILALESDFLGTEGFTVEQIRQFASRRDIQNVEDFSRLYCVEGAVSLTGANADYRLRLRPDAQLEFVCAILNEIGPVRSAASLDAHLPPQASAITLSDFASRHGLSIEILMRLVDDLLEHRARSVIIAGNTLPVEVHIAVNYLNELLGGTALLKMDQSATAAATTTPDDWASLIQSMKRGEVGMVIHWDVNPVFHFPAAMGYADALKAVPLSVSMVEEEDETAAGTSIVLPVHHALESWGDFEVRTGIISLQQPVIAPLYDTRQREGALLTWLSVDGRYREDIYHDYLMQRWEDEVFPQMRARTDFRTYWFSALHDGVVERQSKAAAKMKFIPAALGALTALERREGFVLALRENHSIGDGRFANNGWLQELPHPISKVVWDNYAALSPSTAQELLVTQGDVIEVVVGDVHQRLPVFVQPGLADRFISIELGYGRTHAGPIGSGVGVRVADFLGVSGLTGGRIFTVSSVTKAPGTHRLVSTQEHHLLDEGPLSQQLKNIAARRGIVREGTLEEYRRNPDFIHEEQTKLPTITPRVEYTGLKWAMAIDLNKCVGCNACVSACNVENNVPVVGKDQVGRGREMQWIRIDRYFSGSPDAPSLSHQPMLCQHCDNAPCENVCPVAATNHSPDGLNQMVYNRCVGTKYCSNNCPYKVRRFNFYNFRSELADGYYEQEPQNLAYNPEVTVRSRGVMEKCTFCIQRIMEAREHATEHGRALKGSDVRTACQEACPAQAITFGDMNDPDSDITRFRKMSLGYYVLDDVNTRPNVTYVARLRNLHSEKPL